MPEPGQDVTRVALTFAWTEDAAHPQARAQVPPADAVAQLFYVLNVLYVEAFAPRPERGSSTAPSGRRQHGVPAQWVKIATRLMTTSRTIGSDWPGALLAPRVDPAQALRVESMVMASPLELLLAIPAAAVPAAAALERFVDAIEKTWNARGRILLERDEIALKRARAQAELEQFEDPRGRMGRDDFELLEGAVLSPTEPGPA
jgi:hypothetical protein